MIKNILCLVSFSHSYSELTKKKYSSTLKKKQTGEYALLPLDLYLFTKRKSIIYVLL